MNYIGKLWIDKKVSMKELADIAALKDVHIFETEDAVGTMEYMGYQTLVIFHCSWGTIEKVQAIKIYVHHAGSFRRDEDFIWRIFLERLSDVIKHYDEEKVHKFHLGDWK